MKIAVIGANGKVRSRIVKEAVNREHKVTAIVRNENKSVAGDAILKDLFHLTEKDLENFDISNYGIFSMDS